MSRMLNAQCFKSSDTRQHNIAGPFIARQSPDAVFRQTTGSHPLQYLSTEKRQRFWHAVDTCQILSKNPGVHSRILMNTAGFQYTGKGDTVHCDECGLEASGWTSDMKPFNIHAQRKPECSYVRSLQSGQSVTVPSTKNSLEIDDEQRLSKRRKTEVIDENCLSHPLIEVDTLKQIRKRTFSHWPHRTLPSSTQMIEAGFFSCNVGDRVICLYCDIICQHWILNTDDPWEVHRTLSPKCRYVTTKLASPQILLSNSNHPVQSISELNETAHYKSYVGHETRHASFSKGFTKKFPPVADLVDAGFYYTGFGTFITCFYCKGTIHNCEPNDIPIIEHVRKFPYCAYAKQLCGDEQYQKVQESKRCRKENNIHQKLDTRIEINDINSNNKPEQVSGNNTRSHIVNAYLDLPASRSLLDRNVDLSSIKYCCEARLLSNEDEFATDSDLLVACMIHEKQIRRGAEEPTNIIIPSEHMRKIRAIEQTVPDRQDQIANLPLLSPCVLCLTEQKRLACIPCSHLATCIPCGQSLRSCPICHQEIDAFIRVYT